MPMRPARLLLRGGTVVSPGALPAQAMLVVDGVVAWVGADAAAPPAGPETAVVDLAGRLVTPGFVDAHVHVSATGLALTSVDLRSAGDRDAMLAALARGAASTTDAVLLAQGWDESRWPDPRLPSQRELDEAVGDIAVYASRVDSHSAVISTSLARRCAGIERADGWSGDGRVEREAHHQARAVANDLVPDHARAEAIRAALRHAAALGITAVHELNAPHLAPPGDFARIAAVTSSEPLPEVVGYWDSLDRTPPAGSTVRGFAGDLCADGAIGSRTAALAAPYADADTAGHLYIDRARVRDHVAGCTREGTQAGFHVIGDRAMAEVAAGFRAAARLVGTEALRAARHRVEHVEMPSDADIATLAELGVVASVQPAFDAAWGAPGALYDQRLGWRRARPMNPFGRLRAAGVVLAFGSDSPVTPLDPWGAIRAATTHHEEAERLSAAAAMEAHTRGGHRARGDDSAGILTPGAPASYAVWAVPGGLGADGLPRLDEGAPSPVCVQTVVAGRLVHTRDAPT